MIYSKRGDALMRISPQQSSSSLMMMMMMMMMMMLFIYSIYIYVCLLYVFIFDTFIHLWIYVYHIIYLLLHVHKAHTRLPVSNVPNYAWTNWPRPKAKAMRRLGGGNFRQRGKTKPWDLETVDFETHSMYSMYTVNLYGGYKLIYDGCFRK